ncbi:MAG: EpsG family protein [Bacilli bacterium]
MRYLMLLIIMILLILSKKDTKRKKIYIFSSMIILILYSTFRNYIGFDVCVGNDYNSYVNMFNNIENSKIFNSGFAFNMLLLILKALTNNFISVTFFTSTLLICSVYFVSTKVFDGDNDYIWSIFIFISFGIYDLSMSAIRQWIAGSLFLISFKYIKEKKLTKYILLILLASSFHTSAIFLLLVYPFVNMKCSKKKKVIITIIATMVLFVILQNRLELYIISLIDYSYYIRYINLLDLPKSNYTCFIISLFYLMAVFYFYKKGLNKKKYINLKIDYLLMFCCLSLASTQSPFCNRFMQYFMPALMFITPDLIAMIYNNKKNNKLVYKYRYLLTVGVVVFFLLIYIM